MGMVKGGLVEVKDGLVVVDIHIAMLAGMVTVEVGLVSVEVGSVVNHGMLDMAMLVDIVACLKVDFINAAFLL